MFYRSIKPRGENGEPRKLSSKFHRLDMWSTSYTGRRFLSSGRECTAEHSIDAESPTTEVLYKCTTAVARLHEQTTVKSHQRRRFPLWDTTVPAHIIPPPPLPRPCLRITHLHLDFAAHDISVSNEVQDVHGGCHRLLLPRVLPQHPEHNDDAAVHGDISRHRRLLQHSKEHNGRDPVQMQEPNVHPQRRQQNLKEGGEKGMKRRERRHREGDRERGGKRVSCEVVVVET